VVAWIQVVGVKKKPNVQNRYKFCPLNACICYVQDQYLTVISVLTGFLNRERLLCFPGKVWGNFSAWCLCWLPSIVYQASWHSVSGWPFFSWLFNLDMHKLPISVSSKFWKKEKKQYCRVYAQLKLNINQGVMVVIYLTKKFIIIISESRFRLMMPLPINKKITF
jgi:hypothetical protein